MEKAGRQRETILVSLREFANYIDSMDEDEKKSKVKCNYCIKFNDRLSSVRIVKHRYAWYVHSYLNTNHKVKYFDS